jgi:dihydrofolate reductase
VTSIFYRLVVASLTATTSSWPRLMRLGLIQRLIITRVPLLIGTGIPLFGAVPRDIALKHVNTRQYASGLVQSEYEVAVQE